MSTPKIDRPALIDAVVAVMLREGGRLAQWHGWRCEYPDRYGECNCNAEVADEIAREVLPLIADAIEAGDRAQCSERNDPVMIAACKRRGWPIRQHYPDGQPGHPCEGCEAARATDDTARRIARLVRSLGGPS